jgi:tripartite ATP-independent transporter DctP family solute receptor
MVFGLAGCGGSGGPGNSDDSGGSGGDSGSSGAGMTTKAALSLNHVGATTHPYQIGAEKFAELVAEKSGGNITIDVFPASQIASGAKAIEFVQMGSLDIAVESTMSLSNFIPEIDTLNLPFLFDDADQAFRILDGDVGKALEKKCEEQGFKILAWWYNGFRNISNSKRPITKPEDLKGLKIRIPESAVFPRHL